ncbi:AAA family ATPase [Pendulispora albinea]|uniref:ATP-binding protein n=1 Tax=Pendulispora albinea TaxID=2741071 RepID=A0ABZ2M5D0_9BACT
MTNPSIERLEVENYGCIRKGSFRLTPLHALIGPNDSGKSTVLRALRTAAQLGAEQFRVSDDGAWSPFDPTLGLTPNTRIGFHVADELVYAIRATEDGLEEAVYVDGKGIAETQTRSWNRRGLLAVKDASPSIEKLRKRFTVATLVRFDPDHLRVPVELIPEREKIAFADERGTGLASVFDAIINRDFEAFSQIQAGVRTLFPSVAKLGLINVSSSHKEIAVTLADGTRVGAQGMSEGLLYYLAFAALRHIQGSRLYLVEEPENGLHPARIAEVMGVLREISRTNQVVVATHSPLVVNELRGNEISVVTRDPSTGTRAVLLEDVPGFDEASAIYQPGEFWVSYADGKSEEPLLTGKPRP